LIQRWIFRTKDDWVAKKEQGKEKHNFDMAAWLYKYPFPLDPDGQCAFSRALLGWITCKSPFPTSEKTQDNGIRPKTSSSSREGKE
jgi:hypothetical protein